MTGIWRHILIGLVCITGFLVILELAIGKHITLGRDHGHLDDVQAYHVINVLDRSLHRLDSAILRYVIEPSSATKQPLIDAAKQSEVAFRDFFDSDGYLSPLGRVFGDAAVDEIWGHNAALAAAKSALYAGNARELIDEHWRIREIISRTHPFLLASKDDHHHGSLADAPVHMFMYGLLLISILMLIILWLTWRVSQESSRAESFLHTAINALGKGFLIIDNQERVVLANRVYHEQYGFTKPIKPGTPYRAVLDQAIGQIKQFDDLVIDLDDMAGFEDHQAIVNYRLNRMKADNSEWEQELKDGRILLVRDTPIPGGGYVSLRTDVSRLKDIEQRLRQQLRAMDLSTDGIAICNPQGRYTYVNVTFARMLGQENPAQVMGRTWHDFYERSVRNNFVNQVMPGLYQKTNWREEVTLTLLDGTELHQEVTLDLLPTGEIICIARDIQERRAAEQERAELQQQFHQAQKMEAVGRLAGGIAHDFNNILASILGYAHLLEQELPAGTDHHDFAESIRISGERAASLVSQILAFSRTSESDDQQQVNIANMVDEVSRMLRSTLPTTITLSADIAQNLPKVEASPTQLNQVIMNLCVNARDSLPQQKGQIDICVCCYGEEDINRLVAQQLPYQQRVATEPETGASRFLVSRWQQRPGPNQAVRVRVRDTGSGIDPTILPQIFDPFFTTKPVNTGTGLGLSAVHGIVMAAGGIVMVTSIPDQGTVFEIILPAIADSEDQPVLPLQANPALPRGSGLIMVVDDDKAIIDYLTALLVRQGYQVTSFTNPARAIEYLADDQ